MPETMPAVRAHPGEPFYFFSLRSIARLECSSRALWETVGHRVGDLAGAIPIYMGHPLGLPVYVRCMSKFGGGADVQQIRVIAVVMIAVVPEFPPSLSG
jgi:hypothetical protein